MTGASLATVTSDLRLRPARAADIPELERLIARSARGLGVGFYDAAQIDAAVTHVFGVDSELVADGTYFVVEQDGRAIGCGGWSRRRTLFGGDAFVARDSGLLDPACDAARIRAFFVDPAFARRGVAGLLLRASENAAMAAGFIRLELVATLPGIPFYRAAGFVPGAPIDHRAGGATIPFVLMTKSLRGAPREATGDQAGGTQGGDD